MNPIRRILVAVLLAAWVVAPTIGSEGGENAGGTGVWVLPSSTPLCCGTGATFGTPRLVIDLTSLDKNVNLVLSSQMGAAAATLVDQLSGAAVGLTVIGNRLVISAAMLHSLANSGVTQADIVVSDANHLGYRIRLLINAAAGTAQLLVF